MPNAYLYVYAHTYYCVRLGIRRVETLGVNHRHQNSIYNGDFVIQARNKTIFLPFGFGVKEENEAAQKNTQNALKNTSHASNKKRIQMLINMMLMFQCCKKLKQNVDLK